MVCRFIQQENIGILKNEPREIDSRLLPSGQCAEALPPLLPGDLQTVRDTV
jgi:hypothetical protein